MHDNIEQLDETFKAHEFLAPDPAVVLQKANARARFYRRRRRAAQATGVSLLGAGIVVGGMALPNLQRHTGSGVGVTASQPMPASPSASAASSGIPKSYNEQQELDAYFAAGYNYDDALSLGKLWNENDLAKIKAEAGLKLLTGQSLPVSPHGTPASPQEKALAAYFAAGYGYDDAVTLAGLWHETDLGQVKTEAGQELLSGQTLPIPPTGATESPAPPSAAASANSAQDAALRAYFDAGYNYDDSVALGNLWHETDTFQIKVEAGQKLLAGQTLPIKS